MLYIGAEGSVASAGMRIRLFLRLAGLLGLLPLLALGLHAAEAGNATWKLNPATNDWNTATNWTPITVPNSRTDIATFGASNTTAVSTSNTVDLGMLIFAPGAPSYTITGGILFWGKVRNDSGVAQTLNGGWRFYGYSRAGDRVTWGDHRCGIDRGRRGRGHGRRCAKHTRRRNPGLRVAPAAVTRRFPPPSALDAGAVPLQRPDPGAGPRRAPAPRRPAW